MASGENVSPHLPFGRQSLTPPAATKTTSPTGVFFSTLRTSTCGSGSFSRPTTDQIWPAAKSAAAAVVEIATATGNVASRRYRLFIIAALSAGARLHAREPAMAQQSGALGR